VIRQSWVATMQGEITHMYLIESVQILASSTQLINKIINYTQLAQPVVMSPLTHHGRIFAGGVPTRKIPVSAWSTIFSEWSNVADVGYYQWIEEKKDEIYEWIRTGAGSLPDFFKQEVMGFK